MRIAHALIVAAAAVAVPGLARDTQAVPLATPDGASVSCISIIGIDQSMVRSNRVIDFRMRGGRVYRNTLPQDCPSLGAEKRFRYTTPLTQLCSSDIITVFMTTPYMDLGSCGLGQFQPVKLAPR